MYIYQGQRPRPTDRSLPLATVRYRLFGAFGSHGGSHGWCLRLASRDQSPSVVRQTVTMNVGKEECQDPRRQRLAGDQRLAHRVANLFRRMGTVVDDFHADVDLKSQEARRRAIG